MIRNVYRILIEKPEGRFRYSLYIDRISKSKTF
jgi:hypothetical protein